MRLQHSILRRSVAGLLLVLFAFSIIPKIALHDWIVAHTDGTTAVAKSEIDQISKAGFNCAVQNLVAESPFIDGHQTIDLFFPTAYTAVGGSLLPAVFKPAVNTRSLRGPPFIG